jgi:pimeloyl-ACP methyl ester carboxylesterase
LVFGHRPFLVLADHLTRKGIAVLRADDRGVGKSTGRFADATSEDFAQDAAAGVAFLRKHGRIDAARVGLVGHSEGGLVAPMVAVRVPEVAFVVLLAAPGVDGAQILLAQSASMGRSRGMSAEAIAQNQDVQRKIFEIVRTEPDQAVRLEKIKASLAGLPAGAAGQQARQASRPWFRYFLSHDPAPVLEKVRQPVLALTGALDLQVVPTDNLPAIEAALERGGNRDVTVATLDGLNHLFQTAKTGAITEYASIEETFAPAALDRISTWILSRVK